MADKFSGPYGEFDTEDVYRLAQLGFGEARGEGDKGMAAVMQVAGNRVLDANRWGGSIKQVALEPKQFTAFQDAQRPLLDRFHNDRPKDFERAVKIAFDVLSGETPNIVGNATHYYSPAGMQKLVSDGQQKNLLPGWLQRERAASGGETRLGGHVFVGSVQGGRRGSTAAQGSAAEPTPIRPTPGREAGSGAIPARPVRQDQAAPMSYAPLPAPKNDPAAESLLAKMQSQPLSEPAAAEQPQQQSLIDQLMDQRNRIGEFAMLGGGA